MDLVPIWYKDRYCPPPHPVPPPTHTQVMSKSRSRTEFSRNKVYNIRRAILSGDRSCYIPSWCTTKPTILFDLHNSKKSLSDSQLMKQNFQELQSRLSDYQHIYTDGSEVEDKVGCAYISGSRHEKIRLPDGSSIFTAESKAIDMALDYVMNNSLDNKFVIFSDSLSVLKYLNYTSSKNPKIQNVIEKHHELSKSKEILSCWLPSHVGIKGNEAADVKANASFDLEISNFKLPSTDFKPFINRYILSKWQLSWDRATFNKLHEVKPVLGKNTIYRSLRREEVVLTRLRIGHTRLTHSYLLKREDQPFCISCNEPFTVKHFLIDCIEFSHVRRQFFQTNDLRFLLENILVFLKHINLFNKVLRPRAVRTEPMVISCLMRLRFGLCLYVPLHRNSNNVRFYNFFLTYIYIYIYTTYNNMK